MDGTLIRKEGRIYYAESVLIGISDMSVIPDGRGLLLDLNKLFGDEKAKDIWESPGKLHEFIPSCYRIYNKLDLIVL